MVMGLLSGFSVAAQGQQDLVGVYLTWKSDPTTTMTVNWVDLFEGSSNTLWYRQAGNDRVGLVGSGTHEGWCIDAPGSPD
jgi:hypothetical protein